MREAQQNIVPFHGTFSRHGKAQASLALLIWLNENVHLFTLLAAI
ncbi:MAG: hypothetical protein SPF96_04395 [Prevotella sp.]|nr:hypothetical protein [Prevotella sp.]